MFAGAAGEAKRIVQTPVVEKGSEPPGNGRRLGTRKARRGKTSESENVNAKANTMEAWANSLHWIFSNTVRDPKRLNARLRWR